MFSWRYFNDDYCTLDNLKAIDLLKMRPPMVYMPVGNHDGGRTFTEIVRFLEQAISNSCESM